MSAPAPAELVRSFSQVVPLRAIQTALEVTGKRGRRPGSALLQERLGDCASPFAGAGGGIQPAPLPPLSCILDRIAQERLPPRRKRRNQRAVKCKMSNFPIRQLPSQDTSSEHIGILRNP
jgi:hypothetical protein